MPTVHIDRLLDTAIKQKASDIHLSVGLPPTLRIRTRLVPLKTKVLTPTDTITLMKSIAPERSQNELQEEGGADFGFAKASSKASYDAMKSLILDRVKDTFNPEFINRLDETIVYNALSKNDVLKIIDLQLLGLRENLTKLGLRLNVTKKAKEFLINKGFNQEYGVRHLNREIQNLLEDPLSELLLGKTFVDSTGVKVDLKSNKISILPILKKTRPKVLKKTEKKVKP
mgnify:CR=1 FL=1